MAICNTGKLIHICPLPSLANTFLYTSKGTLLLGTSQRKGIDVCEYEKLLSLSLSLRPNNRNA